MVFSCKAYFQQTINNMITDWYSIHFSQTKHTHVISWKFILHRLAKYDSPPSVIKKCTKCGCCLERTSTNLLKSSTLLRRRKSSNLSFRSRLCSISIMYSFCGHLIHPTVASSSTNAQLESMRSNNWIRLTVSLRFQASSNGRTSPYSAPISEYQLIPLIC